MRTCWRALRDFRRVGTFLKMKYNGATKVTMNQNSGHADLVVADKNHKEPTNLDLIYFDESPDYCVRDLSLGEYCYRPFTPDTLGSYSTVLSRFQYDLVKFYFKFHKMYWLQYEMPLYWRRYTVKSDICIQINTLHSNRYTS